MERENLLSHFHCGFCDNVFQRHTKFISHYQTHLHKSCTISDVKVCREAAGMKKEFGNNGDNNSQQQGSRKHI